MRHGWKWWEAFWKWLLDKSRYHSCVHYGDDTTRFWLKKRFKEFEALWREGKIQGSP